MWQRRAVRSWAHSPAVGRHEARGIAQRHALLRPAHCVVVVGGGGAVAKRDFRVRDQEHRLTVVRGEHIRA
jgi:hypothetical protein